ncbi:S-layer homology domain-containing protein [Paenibacillus puldeungensis]|uniref:S-layer homology domain-containing protein n=1 Tax=Paenibacillus puldeungensis TaxID=696536 RepID=A0ABW3S525_9BACL
MKKQRIVSVFLVLALISTFFQTNRVTAAVNPQQAVNFLASEELAPGVHYGEEDVVNYGAKPHRVRFNHLTVDPTANGVRIDTAKAQDTVNAMETIGGQAQREILKGNNVVASINADPYDMDYGVNVGIQVRDSQILISQPNNRYTTDTPVFFVRKSGKAEIGALRASSDIEIRSSSASETTNLSTLGGTVTSDVYAAAKTESAGLGTYSKQISLINRNSFGSWYSDPNKFSSDTLRVFTSSITSKHNFVHYRGSVPENHAYALIRLEGFNGSLQAGITYSGQVVKVYKDEGFNIPDDSIVLAGYNADAAGVAALQENASVNYTVHLYSGAYTEDENGIMVDRGQLADDVVAAVNGYHLLAKDGVINEGMVNNSGTDDNARTVIGITRDGKIEVIAANKPSANIREELTSGTNFRDIAEYMMEELGCVDILNMDGGGSTEMTARRAGSDKLTTVSYPSDGTSRNVSNSLLFISDAPRTSSVGQVVVDSSVKIYQSSHRTFTVRLTDVSGSPMASDGKTITWSAKYGTIDQNGNYIAPSQPSDDIVTATVDGIAGTAKVAVVDETSIASIAFSATGTVALHKGDTYSFAFHATDSSQKEIIIDPALATWEVTGDIGNIKDGLLTVSVESGLGTVSAKFLNKTYSAPVSVGLDEQLIDGFEGDQSAYHINSKYIYNNNDYRAGQGNNMVGIETDPSKVKNGTGSLYWIYDTKDWPMNGSGRATNGTMYINPDWSVARPEYGWTEEKRAALEDQYTAKAMPKKFGLWYYSGDENGDGISDNYDCMSTAYFKYGPDGKKGSLKLTPNEHMEWVGWKWVEVDVPQDWTMPIKFDYMMISNINKATPVSKDYRTTLMVDDLKYIYSDEPQDLAGPVFTDTAPIAGGIYSDTLDFSTTIKDVMSKVKPGGITVTVNSAPFTDYTFNEETGKLGFKLTGLKNGESYRVIVKALDTKNNESVPYIDNTYTVDTSPDTEAPVIRQVTPSSQVTVRIPSPRVTFKLTDTKSGVDAKSIKVTLDGKNVPVYYDATSGWGYAQPDFELAAGSVNLTVEAKDKNGNAMTAYTDVLKIDPIAQPADPQNYKISVVPDTQGNVFSDKIFGRVKTEDSELVVHLGDIVDNATETEFKEGKDYIESTGKPYLVLAGNHEGGNNNLDLYYKYFGSPTYSFKYGSTLIVVLNSAYNQSINVSDPTQYHYLEEVLKSNKLPNVYVFNHVITRDDYYTEHNMQPAEAEQFEGILSDYKKNHPNTNVNAVFGHLHTLHSWEVGGVNYIIGGNGAQKGYVNSEQGNILGSGMITVKNGVGSYGFNPLLSKVYIKNAALIGDTISSASTSQIQLDLYGDFREYPSNYVARISNLKYVNTTWRSSDTSMAMVDENGVVTLKKEGTAQITATSGGKSSTITIKSVDASKITASKISLSIPKETRIGERVIPTVSATDPYGAVFVVNNRDVKFSFSNSLMRIDDGAIIGTSVGHETVTATYQGKSASAEITIKPIDSPPGSSESSGGMSNDKPSDTSKNEAGKDNSNDQASDSKDTKSTAPHASFSDISSHWAQKEINEVVSKGLFKGTDADKFSPNAEMTRSMFVTVLWRLAGTPAITSKPTFADVQSKAWYYNGVMWATENGIVKGIGEGFSPAASITREQLVVMMYRYAKNSGKVAASSGNLLSYSDARTVSSWALDAMKWAVGAGLINGGPNGALNPQATATRAEVAAIIARSIDESNN